MTANPNLKGFEAPEAKKKLKEMISQLIQVMPGALRKGGKIGPVRMRRKHFGVRENSFWKNE